MTELSFLQLEDLDFNALQDVTRDLLQQEERLGLPMASRSDILHIMKKLKSTIEDWSLILAGIHDFFVEHAFIVLMRRARDNKQKIKQGMVKVERGTSELSSRKRQAPASLPPDKSAQEIDIRDVRSHVILRITITDHRQKIDTSLSTSTLHPGQILFKCGSEHCLDNVTDWF